MHYVVEASRGLQDEIVEACVAFWNDHVSTRTPPSDSLPTLGAVQQMARVPKRTAEVDEDMPMRWTILKDQQALVKHAIEEAQRDILLQMGDAEYGVTPFGTFKYTPDRRGRRRFLLTGAKL